MMLTLKYELFMISNSVKQELRRKVRVKIGNEIFLLWIVGGKITNRQIWVVGTGQGEGISSGIMSLVLVMLHF